MQHLFSQQQGGEKIVKWIKETRSDRPTGHGGFPLPKRKLTKQTCAKYGYFTSKVHGQPVQVACYYDDDNKLLGQKIRYADKTFEARGLLVRGSSGNICSKVVARSW